MVTTLAVPFYLWAAVSEFIPHPFYGMTFARETGLVAFVYRGEQAAAAGIARGDHVLDLPRDDIWRGLQLGQRHLDPLRVSTRYGIVTLHPVADRIPIGSAIVALGIQLTGLIVIGVRRSCACDGPG